MEISEKNQTIIIVAGVALAAYIAYRTFTDIENPVAGVLEGVGEGLTKTTGAATNLATDIIGAAGSPISFVKQGEADLFGTESRNTFSLGEPCQHHNVVYLVKLED